MHIYRRIAIVYGAGILQGAAFVLVPSLGGILEKAPYRLGAAAYGALYFPEIIGAVIGALAAGRLHRAAGTETVFRTGLIANAIGMALLTAASLARGWHAYAAILAETACLGFGFGLTLATLNPSAAELFPRAPTAAIATLNGIIGAATALAPLALEALHRAGAWGLMPALLAAGFIALTVAGTGRGTVAAPAATRAPGSPAARTPAPFVLAVFLYAIAEGAFSSWAQVYVMRIGHAVASLAALALSAFWGGMTLWRMLLGFVPEAGRARRVLFLASALGIGASFLCLSVLAAPGALVVAYACAGAACGIYYPYAMAFGLATRPRDEIGFAGAMVAALMIGEGTGSLAPGGLQRVASLPTIYAAAAGLAVPLLFFAWRRPRHDAPPRLCASRRTRP